MNLPRRAARWLFAQPYLLLSCTAFFWAGNNVVGRAVVGTIPPVTFAQLRWSGAALLIFLIARNHLRRDWPQIRARWPMVLVLSFIGISCYNTFAYIGLQYTTALNAVLLQSSMPLMISFFAFLMFRDNLTPGQATGILISLLGVTVIISGGSLAALAGLSLNVGDLWVLLGLGSYAVYSALLRKRPNIHPLSFLAVTIIIGQALILPLFAWELSTGAAMRPTPGAFAALFYVIVFASLVAYLFFNRGVELIGANRAGPFFHLVPVFGSIIAIAALGETLEPFHLVGYAMILSGIALAQYRRPA